VRKNLKYPKKVGVCKNQPMKQRISNAIIVAISALLPCVSCLDEGRSGRETVDQAGSDNSYAASFRLTPHSNYTRLDILNPWQGAKNITHTWYLVEESMGDDVNLPESAAVLRVPLKKLVCMSATHVAMIEALGMKSAIAAISGTELVYNHNIKESVASGEIRETGYDENINRELLVHLKPDLIMTYGVGGESVTYYGKIEEMGLQVMFNADYLEPDPLGKAEWIKVFGALFSRSELADSLFEAVELEYISIRDEVAALRNEPPGVMLGFPWKDTWYISPGNSYISKLIADAGGHYLWSDTKSDYSLPTSLENVFVIAAGADVWLNPGTARSIGEISSAESRLMALGVLKNGEVYNNNKRSLPSGANDYWETGTLRPGLILKDMAKIFNPAYRTGDSLFFYRKLN